MLSFMPLVFRRVPQLQYTIYSAYDMAEPYLGPVCVFGSISEPGQFVWGKSCFGDFTMVGAPVGRPTMVIYVIIPV